MIRRWKDGEWTDTPIKVYKNGAGPWLDVSRRELFHSPDSAFQVRYFKVEPHGYTSFEFHVHEHCVVVLHGSGKVRLGDEWHDIATCDVISVMMETPHQFRAGPEGLGVLCVVDRERDRPVLLQNEVGAGASEQG